MSILERWHEWGELFEARERREKVIMSLLAFAVLYAIFYYGFFFKQELLKADLQQKIETVDKDITRLGAQEKVFSQAIRNDPNAEKKRELARLAQQLRNLDQNLLELSVGLISSAQLPVALRQVLASTDGLDLLGMETLAPSVVKLAEPPKLNSDDDSTSDAQSEGGKDALPEKKHAGLYKHAVVIAVEGEFFHLLDFVKSLETLPWKIYWESLDYQVQDYPKAKVILEVYTLSTEKGFIGA